MSAYVDFSDLKEKVSIEQVVDMLGLKLRKGAGQLRGCCPIHHGTTDREFVVTPAKGLFYCFGPCGGGDMITLVSKVRGLSTKDAGAAIATHFGIGARAASARNGSGNSSPQPQREENGEGAAAPGAPLQLQPLPYLEAKHDLVQKLGVAAETAAHFGAGYAPKGILRGRLAIPIRDRGGTLLAYCGRTVRDEDPALTFPKAFDPASVLFNADRVTAGDLTLVRDPLRVLTAYEAGVENVVAVLTDTINVGQLELLTQLMRDASCESVQLF